MLFKQKEMQPLVDLLDDQLTQLYIASTHQYGNAKAFLDKKEDCLTKLQDFLKNHFDILYRIKNAVEERDMSDDDFDELGVLLGKKHENQWEISDLDDELNDMLACIVNFSLNHTLQTIPEEDEVVFSETITSNVCRP